MNKYLFFLFLSMSCLGQKLHHQMISAQGANVKLSNKMVVLQSVGQLSAIGNYSGAKIIVGQGYIQSFSKSNKAAAEVIPDVQTVTVFPNPVKDIAHFQFSSEISSPMDVMVFDDRGRLILRQQAEPQQNEVSVELSSLAEGLYIVKLETTTNIYTAKILKSK